MADKLLPLTAIDFIKTYCKNNFCSNYIQRSTRPITFEYTGGAQCILLRQTDDTKQLTMDFFHNNNQDAVLGTPKKGSPLSIWTGSRGWQAIQTGATNTLSANEINSILTKE